MFYVLKKINVHLLDELLVDFSPGCCEWDGGVLQVSLHLSVTLSALGGL